jgi:hypothetical protein
VLIKVENVHVACRVIIPSAKTISTSAKTKPIQTKSNPKTALLTFCLNVGTVPTVWYFFLSVFQFIAK